MPFTTRTIASIQPRHNRCPTLKPERYSELSARHPSAQLFSSSFWQEAIDAEPPAFLTSRSSKDAIDHWRDVQRELFAGCDVVADP